uniref:Uncharacterized protein n=1 Tax=Oryza glumipatula TaxID=40148 RepID=A0A0E0B8D2_9ORYZ
MACPYPATIIPHASWLPRKKASNISPAATAHGAVQQPVHHNSATEASLPVSICNTLDKAIDRFIDPPERRPLVDPQRVLSGNFEHVVELPPTRCPLVLGSIPSCLAGGAYIRNGPNPQHQLQGRTHHLFDGDGMLHSLLFPAPSSTLLQEPVFCSRYVHTYKYLLEREAGVPVFPNFVAGFQGVAGLARMAVMFARALAGQISMNMGFGLANTSILFFAKHLYALCESYLPYTMCINPATGEVTTLSRCDFDGRRMIGMTAHPKKDPVTGELFAFRYSMFQPFLTYICNHQLLHDFAITEHYAIFPESQLVMRPMNMAVRGGSLIGLDSAMVDMIHINLRTGAVLRTALSPESLEFGVIHQDYVGRYNRYGYFGVSAQLPRFSGIRKLDFAMVGADDCTVARRDFGPGCFVGEPFFVPSNDNGDGNEDNGYVVCYTHKEDTGESQFVVMDARSPELEIVAAVQLPARVPYGFHGLFVTQAELLSQQK